ncbi:MAG TPA: Rne/Rng family ribonuclease [Jiangellaceae bacterium]
MHTPEGDNTDTTSTADSDGTTPSGGAGSPAAESRGAGSPAAETPGRRRVASRAAGPPAASPIFQAPEFTELAPPAGKAADTAEDKAQQRPVEGSQTKKDQRGGSGSGDTEPEDADAEDGDPDQRRRRRRGGRGRRKKSDQPNGTAPDGEDAGDGSTTRSDEQSSETATADETPDGDGEDDESSGSRRRRRRRRRGDSDAAKDTDESAESDETVVAVKGSTRIEAKKQRRREGREAGRRRPPVVSEAEFLARRESVERVMAVRQNGDLTQIGVLEDGVLVEHYVSRGTDEQPAIGNVYLGRVQNVLPAMEAAFVDIGRGRNAVLYAGEVDWAGLGHVDGQPKKIEEILKSGQSILVQVTKEPVGHKGARLTGQISLPGRYVVYVPGGSMSGISRKLPENERNRLKKILKQVVPEDAGVIVRTAAEGASEEELTHDVARLRSQWDEISKKASGNAPQLLHGEPDLAIKVVRDLFNEDFTKLVVAGDDAWKQIESYVAYVASSLRERLEKWSGDGDIFAAYRIDEQIAKALERKVWLPSGGSLVIDRTEAMTVIDVNTGKFTGSGGNLEETVTKNNLEAAEEVVRQLRLRDIGGIIVIDFIDMVLESNRDLVLRRLVECLGRDRTKHQVAEVTSLGLVQMTRKRIGSGLFEAFTEVCEHCNGRGVHVHVEPVEPSAKPSGQSGRSDRRGRRRRSQQSEQPAEPTTRGGFEASATPGKASPADLLPVSAETGAAAAKATELAESSAGGEDDGRAAADGAGEPTEVPPSETADAIGTSSTEQPAVTGTDGESAPIAPAVTTGVAPDVESGDAVSASAAATPTVAGAQTGESAASAAASDAGSGTHQPDTSTEPEPSENARRIPAWRSRRRVAQRPAGSPEQSPEPTGATPERTKDESGEFDPESANSVP